MSFPRETKDTEHGVTASDGKDGVDGAHGQERVEGEETEQAVPRGHRQDGRIGRKREGTRNARDAPVRRKTLCKAFAHGIFFGTHALGPY